MSATPRFICVIAQSSGTRARVRSSSAAQWAAWIVEGGPSGLYLRSRPDDLDDGVRRVTVVGQAQGHPDIEAPTSVPSAIQRKKRRSCGGSSGIGKAFVGALCERGYVVVTCGRDPAKLRQLEAEHPGVETHAVDVSDAAAMRDFSSGVLAAHPRIDLLISNAGGLREIDFTSETLQSLDLTAEIRSNLEGAIHLISNFLPGLRRAGRSSIVIVSSGYAVAPSTRAPIYSASKAALHSLSKSLRRQLAPLNITVTEVAPPVVDTPSVAHRKVAKMSAKDVVEQTLSAASKGVKEVYPGQARWLPLLLRIAPSFAENMVAKT